MILQQREELQRRHKEELKTSLLRKHALANAMEIMRATNDSTLLDQILSGKKGKSRRRREDGEDDPRFSQTA